MAEASINLPHGGNSADRLGLTLFLALALHAIIILGVGFTAPEQEQQPHPLSLEVTLVHSRSDEAPEDAQYLAQVDHVGGGTVEERVRPSSTNYVPTPVDEEGDSANPTLIASPPPPQEEARQELLSTEESSTTQVQLEQVTPQEHIPEVTSADLLLARQQEIARLSAEIRQQQQAYAQRPRQTYISANTKSYTHALYEDAWRLKVEHVGNFNYPDEARRRNLSGSLMLDVAINADGTLHDVTVLRSSGHTALDEGAIRIVRMAAPFAPFTDAMRRETDILHIVRTWQFRSNNSLVTR